MEGLGEAGGSSGVELVEGGVELKGGGRAQSYEHDLVGDGDVELRG
jgi:hypothetical protein